LTNVHNRKAKEYYDNYRVLVGLAPDSDAILNSLVEADQKNRNQDNFNNNDQQVVPDNNQVMDAGANNQAVLAELNPTETNIQNDHTSEILLNSVMMSEGINFAELGIANREKTENEGTLVSENGSELQHDAALVFPYPSMHQTETTTEQQKPDPATEDPLKEQSKNLNNHPQHHFHLKPVTVELKNIRLDQKLIQKLPFRPHHLPQMSSNKPTEHYIEKGLRAENLIPDTSKVFGRDGVPVWYVLCIFGLQILMCCIIGRIEIVPYSQRKDGCRLQKCSSSYTQTCLTPSVNQSTRKNRSSLVFLSKSSPHI
jgi:hypothetical protein